MKKVLLLFCVLSIMSCSKDEETKSSITKDDFEISQNYYSLTNEYGFKKSTSSNIETKSWKGFWRWIKKVAKADAIGAGSGFLTGGPNGALGGAIASSISVIVEEEKQTSLPIPDFKNEVDLESIKQEVYNPLNKFEEDAYNHYEAINKFIENKKKKEELNVITDPYKLKLKIANNVNTIFTEDNSRFGKYTTKSDESLAKELERLELLPGESLQEKAYYDRVYEIRNNTIDEKLYKVLDLYNGIFSNINDEMSLDSFIEYSKKMEKLVMEDNTLPENIKNSLLFEMATLRYGAKYYSEF